jgi:hypothetical protein
MKAYPSFRLSPVRVATHGNHSEQHGTVGRLFGVAECGGRGSVSSILQEAPRKKRGQDNALLEGQR